MIYLLRHGETEWNRQRRLQGHLDSPLTARGLAQATAMGATLRALLGGPGDFRMVSSPLGRARQTALRVAEALGCDPAGIAEEPRLMEHGFGIWEGELEADLPGRFPDIWQAREADKWAYQVPGGESYALVAARLAGWLAEQPAGERLIVISHGLAGRILRGLYGRAGPAEVMALTEPQDAVFRLSQGVIARFDAAMEPEV
ncbi:MAG: histidine phosphatase family protein [Kiloniellaceae bacterium]